MDEQLPQQPTSQQVLQPEKGGVNIWMIISIVLFVVLVGGGAYFLGKGQIPFPMKQTTSAPSPTISVVVSPTQVVATAIPTIANGTATGILCYPASLIPPGTITAKSTTTNKEVTQSYSGTQNGGGTTYSMQLMPDTYHMKFTPTQYPTVVGYYTDYSSCVGNPGNNPNCSGQKTRPLLDVNIKSGETVSKVNLCDYYYPLEAPPQF